MTDEPDDAAARRRPRRAATRRCAASPSLLGAMPAGARSARSCTACSRRPTSRRPTSMPSWRARGRGAGAPARRHRRCRGGGRRACAPRSRRRSAARRRPRLRDLARADRLDELDFELPLVGGDEPTGALTLDAIAAVLRAHLPPGDPLAGYADRLGDPGAAPAPCAAT